MPRIERGLPSGWLRGCVAGWLGGLESVINSTRSAAMGCMACLSLSLFLPLSLSLSLRAYVCVGVWKGFGPFHLVSPRPLPLFVSCCCCLAAKGPARMPLVRCVSFSFSICFCFFFCFCLLAWWLIELVSFFLFRVSTPTPSLVATHAPFIYIFFFAFPATPQCSPGTERSRGASGAEHGLQGHAVQFRTPWIFFLAMDHLR